MVFYPASRRFVDEASAKRISRIARGVQKVGVFVNEESASIIEKARKHKLDAIQLHGEESVAFVQQLRRGLDKVKNKQHVRIIKSFRIKKDAPGKILPALMKSIKEYSADYFLLDAFREGAYGGTGRRFDWRMLEALKARLGAAFSQKIIVAGGIGPKNIKKAMSYGPFAVDISSGVEAS